VRKLELRVSVADGNVLVCVGGFFGSAIVKFLEVRVKDECKSLFKKRSVGWVSVGEVETWCRCVC